MATLMLTGVSGKKYEFQIYAKETTFTDVGGVYVITKKDENSLNHTIIYIGQTDHLS